jgi:hypothetical protein
MTYDFFCDDDHLTSLTFPTITAASSHFESPVTKDTYDETTCTVCGKLAIRSYRNSGTLFYGSGWDNPAPSGRSQTVGADATKVVSSLGATLNRDN